MKLTCIIADDEQLARSLLEGYVKQIPQLELIASCKNAQEAQQALETQPADVLFLDIQMPDTLGTDFVQRLPYKPSVIFTTAYSQYAVESYELQAVDYLLKPISFERFKEAVDKALVKGKQQEVDYLIVKADHRIHKLHLKDILYIEGLREYVAYHHNAGRLIALESLKKLEEGLPNTQFLRVHKSYIVNKEKVTSMHNNSLFMEDIEIPIGKSYKEIVREKLF